MNDISTLAASNSLADFAARIKAEHTAVAVALKDSVRHGIAAGELLIEAKAQLKHGEWLPWLRDHVEISERTAQLYMRLARNRAEIEANTQALADLTLDEAAALLFLTSDMRKMLNFTRDCEHLSGEELIQRCVAEGVAVMHTPDYDPLAGGNEEERREWGLFVVFLSFDEEEAARGGMQPRHAADHVEWVVQGGFFHTVEDWIGEKGNKWRARSGMRAMPEKILEDWAKFRVEHAAWTEAEIIQKQASLQSRFEQAKADGCFTKGGWFKRRRPLKPEVDKISAGAP